VFYKNIGLSLISSAEMQDAHGLHQTTEKNSLSLWFVYWWRDSTPVDTMLGTLTKIAHQDISVRRDMLLNSLRELDCTLTDRREVAGRLRPENITVQLGDGSVRNQRCRY
jgi:hypothetical protein